MKAMKSDFERPIKDKFSAILKVSRVKNKPGRATREIIPATTKQ
jgi:hypothetical protein